jgi:energy-converting hydrogenase Eha subunit G
LLRRHRSLCYSFVLGGVVVVVAGLLLCVVSSVLLLTVDDRTTVGLDTSTYTPLELEIFTAGSNRRGYSVADMPAAGCRTRVRGG